MLSVLKYKTTEGIELTYNEGEIIIKDKSKENSITVDLNDFEEFVDMLYKAEAIEITTY